MTAPELRRLDAFTGRWRTEGRLLDDETTFAGTDSYEWLAGGHFLVHRVDVRLGGEETKAIELIGWDAERGTYPMHSFDSQGQHTVMQATFSDGTWHFIGESMRFTGAFAEDGAAIEGTWELRGDGGTWRPWMHVRLTRVAT